jgi:hypothetical protein
MQASGVTLEQTFRTLTICASNLIEAMNASQANGGKCVAVIRVSIGRWVMWGCQGRAQSLEGRHYVKAHILASRATWIQCVEAGKL